MIYQVHFPAWNLPHICSNTIFFLGLLFRCFMTSICHHLQIFLGASQVVLVVKNLPANAGDVMRHGFDPWVGKIPCRRAGQPTPIFLPGESQGQRSLAGYSPRGQKELNATEVLQRTVEIFLDPPVLNPFPWNLCLFLLSLLNFVEAYPLVVSWERVHQRQIF